MILHWPQITYAIIWLLGCGIAISQHGKPKEGKNNMIYTILAGAIQLWLLYEGGFFTQQQP